MPTASNERENKHFCKLVNLKRDRQANLSKHFTITRLFKVKMKLVLSSSSNKEISIVGNKLK